MDGISDVTERLYREAIYEKAFEKWGEEGQFIVAIEELSELQKEVCKILRGKGDINHLAEEIADVRIMVEQLEFIFHCKPDVARQMRYKIKRLEERLEG